MNLPAKNPVTAFGGFLEKFKPQLSLALPKHMNADRMARLALTAFSTTPALQQCTPQSIAASIMVAGQLGLERCDGASSPQSPRSRSRLTTSAPRTVAVLFARLSPIWPTIAPPWHWYL